MAFPDRHPPYLLFVLVIALTALAGRPAVAQIKIDCNTPRVGDWRGEAATSIEEGKRECEEAERLAKLASDLRRDVKDHEKKSETEMKRADERRKEAQDKRKEAERRNREAREVLREAEQEVARMQRHDDAISSWDSNRSVRIPFRLGAIDTVATPTVLGMASEAARDDALDAFAVYAVSVDSLAAGESSAVIRLADLLDQEARSLDARADLHEQRARRYRATAVSATRAAEGMELAARVSEEAARIHQLNAVLDFLANDAGPDEKKATERAIKFVESNMGRLPNALLDEANALVRSSRASIQ